jgi:hypothetical protein
VIHRTTTTKRTIVVEVEEAWIRASDKKLLKTKFSKWEEGWLDQADAERIVIRRPLKGLDDMPGGQPPAGLSVARGFATLGAYLVFSVTPIT